MEKLIMFLLISVVNAAILLLVRRLHGFETAMLVGVIIIITYLVALIVEIENK